MFCLVFKYSVGKNALISFFDQDVLPLAELIFSSRKTVNNILFLKT